MVISKLRPYKIRLDEAKLLMVFVCRRLSGKQKIVVLCVLGVSAVSQFFGFVYMTSFI